ncbi:MAG: histidine kinase [Betaproteobacteria bacterium]|nr:histidine kinase [Betaproteobacteria bacterium]
MIRQIQAVHPLPDWRNLGVVLRVLLGGNVLALAAALVQSPDLRGWPWRFVEFAALVEPVLLLTLGVVAGIRDLLWKMPPRAAQFVVVAVAACLAALQSDLWNWLGLTSGTFLDALRAALLAAAAAILLLFYFTLRLRAISPSMSEARLSALNARIRPHFLFNSLNAVLSLIRAEPRRAEEALESLSDLFRAALRDPAERVPLSDEIALARQYLDLERLRLGERLRIQWEVADVPLDEAIPPLMLQPLLENAVYHGIEPRPEGGTVAISFSRKRDELVIIIANPSGGSSHVRGNHMAVANIRERLALYYDLEARLDIEEGPENYRVLIHLPCRTHPHP